MSMLPERLFKVARVADMAADTIAATAEAVRRFSDLCTVASRELAEAEHEKASSDERRTT